MLETHRQPAETGVSARERILDAAYELFSRRGIQAVGVNEVIERAGVATATLYRHFPSKDELVLAFLDLREQRWTKDLIEAGAMRRGSNPEERLLAIFDVLDEWFHRDDFEAGSFIKVLLELGPQHPAGRRQRSASRADPRDRTPLSRGSRPARHRFVRALVAHPHGGLDRRSSRGRCASRAARQGDGTPCSSISTDSASALEWNDSPEWMINASAVWRRTRPWHDA